MHDLVPCPFVDGSDHRCKGHINRIEEYHNSNIRWDLQTDGTWRFTLKEQVLGEPGSFYRLFCTEKHDQMKVSHEELSDALKRVLSVR